MSLRYLLRSTLPRFSQTFFNDLERTTQVIRPTSHGIVAPFQRSIVTVTKSSASSPPLTSSQPVSSPDFSPLKSEGDDNLTVQVQQDNSAIVITSSAVQQINHLAKLKFPEDPKKIYLRVYVDAGGCSGFQYKFELENMDEEMEDDEDIVINCIDANNEIEACVVIDEASLDLLKGSTIDYVREMIRSSFAIVSNPQSESACGCGSSFAIKNFSSNPALD